MILQKKKEEKNEGQKIKWKKGKKKTKHWKRLKEWKGKNKLKVIRMKEKK